MGKLKKIVQNIFFYIFSKLVPELSLLKDKTIYWPYFKSSLFNSTVDKFVKLAPPYKLIDSKIDEGTYIAPNSMISVTEIGKFCSIGPNFLSGWGIHPSNGLSTSPMFYSTLKQNGQTLSVVDKIEERKKIKIGNDVFIGSNVTILDGVTIGDGAIIGAGAVVSKNIPPFAIAVGCPIEIIKYRFSQDIIDKLLKIKWWDFNDVDLKNVERYFFDVEIFIDKYYKR